MSLKYIPRMYLALHQSLQFVLLHELHLDPKNVLSTSTNAQRNDYMAQNALHICYYLTNFTVTGIEDIPLDY